ncbi:hypothetical protein J7L01_03440, partial [bacterium]|nr:hypothetical protein [bacterium]
DDVGISVEPEFARICRGDDVVIHAAATGGIAPFEWTWVPNHAILPPESSVVSAFPETTSIYRLIVTDSAGCSAEDTIMIVVDSLIASLTVEASAEETLIILGESTRLHAELSDPVGAIGYSWTPEEPLDIPHLPNPWAEPTESGWFVVTVTDSQGTCVYSATDSVYIRVEDTSSCALSISDISPNSIVCRGDSIALWVEVDGAVGEVHYLWRPAEYLDDPTLSVPTAFPPFTTRFWVVVSDDSCSDSAYTTVAVDTLSRSMEIMDALATRDSIDIGDSTRLYALVSGVAGELIVHWSPEGDLSCPDSTSTWASPIAPTTYTLVAADSQRCGTHYDTARVFVYVDTWLGCSLSVAASGWDSICPGESALLSATAAGAMGELRYSWSPTEGLDSPLSQTTFASPETTTLYTATAVDDSGCIDTASVVVWVKRIDEGALPPLDICRGDTIALPLSFYAGRPPISWLWNPSLFLDDSSAGAPRCFPESTITYSIIAIDGEGCLSTTELTIAVDSVVTTMSIALSPDTAIAAGGSAGLRAAISGGVGSISHSWSPALWLDDPSSLAPTASPPTRTVYRFTAIDSQRCGAFAATDSVVVDILPAFECSLSVVPDFAESSICRGGSIALPTAVSGAMGAVEYSWHPASHLDDPHAPSPVASGLDSSMAYTVVATDDSCSDSATVLVFVKRLRFEPPMRICRGETLSLSAEFEFASEPVIWEWSPETGLSAPHESTSLAFPETTTTYSITATDLAGCTDSVAFTIEVDSIARTMEIEAIASPSLVLSGDSSLVIVNIVGAAGDVSVRWFGLGLESPDDEASWAMPPCSTWYFVSVFDSQECGIDTLTDSVFIAVVSAICSLDVTAGSGDTICRGDTASLFAECRFASGDVAWSWRPADDLDDPNIQNPSASPDFTTLYWAVASDSAGCVDSTSVLLIVHQPPMAEAYAPSDSIEAGNDIELNAFPEDESFAYLWAGPNGFSSAARCPNIEDADLDDAGWYFVDVTDGFGCTGTDSLWITVYRPAASPNIHATPSQLHFEIEVGGSETLPLVVGNSGD